MSATYSTVLQSLIESLAHVDAVTSGLLTLKRHGHELNQEAREASQILSELKAEIDRYADIEKIHNGDSVSRGKMVDIAVAFQLLRYDEVGKMEDWQLTELIQGSIE